jgi:hypothetical protein
MPGCICSRAAANTGKFWRSGSANKRERRYRESAFDAGSPASRRRIDDLRVWRNFAISFFHLHDAAAIDKNSLFSTRWGCHPIRFRLRLREKFVLIFSAILGRAICDSVADYRFPALLIAARLPKGFALSVNPGKYSAPLRSISDSILMKRD